jgi:hypothetical protein
MDFSPGGRLPLTHEAIQRPLFFRRVKIFLPAEKTASADRMKNGETDRIGK